MNWETMCCFGDSITIGARSYCGYPEWAGYFLEKADPDRKWNIVNEAISGYTSIQLARLMKKDYSNLIAHEPMISTVMIGTNDVKLDKDFCAWEIGYRQVVLSAKLITYNDNVILIKIPPLMKGVMYPYKISMEKNRKKRNKVIDNIAKDFGLNVFEFKAKPKYYFDGVHLNSEGSKEFGNQLANFILKERGLK